jgi:predicted  nucleic acid-binding Zn-ribbon protein
MEHTESPRFVFPKIKRVQLHAFSLYSLEPNVSLSFGDGVLCLAGANGIGKSTFLAALNYALTGAVPNPARRFLSAGSYLKEAQEFTVEYFDGRINETDREMAAVSIDFDIGDAKYALTRGLFDPLDVRKLTIAGGSSALPPENELSNVQRDGEYRTSVCRAIGLSSFEQFVFLQHFLFTFDESRHLLFWDKAVSEQMLYLCFGGDPTEAARADHINREMEKAGSWGRNLQFQASNVSKRIEVLEKSLSSPDSATPDIEARTAEFRALNEEFSRRVAFSEDLDARLNEAELRVTQASAELVSHRNAYAAAFDRFVNKGAEPRNHPLVSASLADPCCPVCRSVDPQRVVRINAKLDTHICPLCESSVATISAPDPAMTSELAGIDSMLSNAKRKLEDVGRHRERLLKEARTARDAIAKARVDLSSFEEVHQESLDFIKGKAAALDGPVAQNLNALHAARTQLIAQRDEAYGERDKYRDELKGLQSKLALRYAKAERTFVPLFRKLAELFLGIDLDVSLAERASTGVSFALELRGGVRRNFHQLSESQRFFVDIALRMALAKQISSETGRCALFIDTPEGSLDIAYEERAGEMFADFVRGGHDLVMTANINSSKLLTTLARICGTRSMKIVQMTGWTELSDVQQKAQRLFQDAFSEITAALHSESLESKVLG